MSLKALPSAPAAGQKTRIAALPQSADSAWIAAQARPGQCLLVLCASAQAAQRLKTEIAFFAPAIRVALLPDWETLPYDHFSPHADLVSERLATLWQIRHKACEVVIAPVATAMVRLAPPSFLAAHTFFLKTGQKLDGEELRTDLVAGGYQHVSQVMAPGEFSIRGGLIDLYPMGSALPLRIDLFDDEIETIKTFDPDTQRTLYPLPEVHMLPAREYPSDDAGVTAFRQHWRERMEGDPSRSRIYRDVSAGAWPAGIEYYLPLFFAETATLFDYFSQPPLAVLLDDVQAEAENVWRDIESRYQMGRNDPERPILPPADVFLRPDALMGQIKQLARFEAGSGDMPALPVLPLPPLAVERRADAPLQKLAAFIGSTASRVLILAESLGRRETLLQFLADNGIKPQPCDDWAGFIDGKARLAIAVGPLWAGFALTEPAIAVVTESELYQHVTRSHSRRRKAGSTDAMLRDLAEIKIGDPVVHEAHGIGRYQGLVNLDLGVGETEMMQLEYADGAILYVPVSQLALISRYAGQASDEVQLHKLGNPAWDKAKRKAAEKARDTAAELLNLYAQRAAREGHAFAMSHHDYDAFAAGFGFEETPDQADAISAVIADMTSGKPMDRLVCGDVGFGKTEVALRAAFVAVLGGKQVAVLVPTTLLAEQHAQSFADRFADWPVKIAALSRFNSGKETKAALAGLADGSVDIVIGTHKLVQPDVQFKRLGLVIIDEEHRFGVRQKEQLKRLRANVDVLTMTATPIPRTLSMAIEGLRDFSVIATAPSRRLSVKTFVSPTRNAVIREAVLRELKRGGQVFFLHNEVDTIENMRQKLAELVPEARIAVAHGQLAERELEQVMRDFMQQRSNVLLCSTIIETGIDIPNANTILINRADRFGLAQLHQLRGRVGRSHHQAYAYLLTPDGMTRDAQKRLEAIQLSGELGAGFYLAMHDLEIRGAGEVLGEGQSGEMQEVGFGLFTEMLKQAVRDLKKGREPDLDAPLGVTTEINLYSPALLPDAYCPGVHERLVIYKRLASCESSEEIDAIYEELIDRFGLPPQAVKTLIESHLLRLMARPLGIAKLEASDSVIQLAFVKKPDIDPVKIIALMQSGKGYKMAGPDKLRVEVKLDEVPARVIKVKEILKALQ
ncbi:transcription-repair coupling factor [Rhodobacteraceae bacterium CH30]|nr:transcription-repair coupling factor [Rhodobacteraceae bacterium CH30]